MGDEPDLLRASRDGDQFHYYWAARQALRLLEPGTALTQLVVEGPADPDSEATPGDEVIDLAEYRSGTTIADGASVVYRQFKHSTYRADEPMTGSELRRTLIGFARKYRAVLANWPERIQAVRFELVSNRPTAPAVVQAIEYLSSGGSEGDADTTAKYLYRQLATEIPPAAIKGFLGQFSIDDHAPQLLKLRDEVQQDLSELLPGSPGDERVLLKEMVADRATSIRGADPSITRATVLAALKTTSEELLPAPCRLVPPEHLVTTEQSRVVANQIRLGPPVSIVHAAGGIGKSVFAATVGELLPHDSVTLTFDCFDNGAYRRASSPRHQHQQALVQLSNELAARGLGHPLIPSSTASSTDYVRVFLRRLEAASSQLSQAHPTALLAVVIDASDNAVMAAKDVAERSFVQDLIRESFPSNTRLIFLCRTERVALLQPPPGCSEIELQGFTRDETREFLSSRFEATADADAAEFHRRTSGNPRVQAMVADRAESLPQALSLVGEHPANDVDLLDQLLARLVADSRDAHHQDARQFDLLCTALAALRPRIPIEVLTELSGVDPGFIFSFVADLGRPLLIDGMTVQFRDEPSETWFRKTYRPTGPRLDQFLSALLPLAGTSSYVAASIPQLLWEGGRAERLVDLALSSDGLPTAGEGERRTIEEQRVQYALKASLRSGGVRDAARLALKAGAMAAGHERRLNLIRANTDVSAQFLPRPIIDELVAQRALKGEWPGSNLQFEGGLLSCVEGEQDYARSRLRSAAEWIYAWVHRPDREADRSHVEIADIAELSWGLLNTDGPNACVEYLSRWTPRNTAYEAGLIIATRLADANRIADMEELAWSARRLGFLQLAVAEAAFQAAIILSERGSRRVVGTLKRLRRPLRVRSRATFDNEGTPLLSGAVWAVAMGLRHKLLTTVEAERILTAYLPARLPPDTGARYSRQNSWVLLCGYATLAWTRGAQLDVDELIDDRLKTELETKHVSTDNVRGHQEMTRPLAPWASLWATSVITPENSTVPVLAAAMDATFDRRHGYEPPFALANAVGRICVRVLAATPDPALVQRFRGWLTSNELIYRPTRLEIVRVAARTAGGLEDLALEVAEEVRHSLDGAQEDARSRADDLVLLARAIYGLSTAESFAHFTRAVEITDQIGDDAWSRWQCLLECARAVGRDDAGDRRAYQLARVAEALEPYTGDSLDLAEAIIAISGLRPTFGLATASRWRDRRFISLSTLTRALTNSSDSPASNLPLVGIALTAMSDHIATVDTFISLMEADGSEPGNARLTDAMTDLHGSDAYSEHQHSRLMALTASLTLDVRARIAAQPAEPAPSNSNDEAERAYQVQRAAAIDWIAALEIWTHQGLSDALEFLSANRHPQELLVDAAARVPRSKIAQFIRTFGESSQPHVFTFARLVDRLSIGPALTAAAREELARAAARFAERFGGELTLRRYEPVDWSKLESLCGRSAENLIAKALTSVGGQSMPLSADEAFALAGRCARLTSASDAAGLFDECAGLFAELAEHDNPDGPLENLPGPPQTVQAAVAGILWVALGDPDAAIRWRAAHAVRLLISLQCREVLDALRRCASGDESWVACADARFQFYELYALQWLLRALRRAASDHLHDEELIKFVPFLRTLLGREDRHIILTSLARDVLLALDARGKVAWDETARRSALAACQPVTIEVVDPWPRQDRPIALEQGTVVKPSSSSATELIDDDDDDDRFRFFFDFKDYWCADLADAFGTSGYRVERLAREAVEKFLEPGLIGAVAEDARSSLDQYRERTWVNKTEWPAEDDLRFYISTNALYIVAGKLLNHTAVLQSPESAIDEFHQWLRLHGPARADGRWLADRRDAPPSPAIDLGRPSYREDDPWEYQVSIEDLHRAVHPVHDWLTVWGYDHRSEHSHYQTVSVQSLLVPPRSGRALLRAAQGAERHLGLPAREAIRRRHELPSPFDFREWIDDGANQSDGREASDPFAGQVRFPPPRFASDVVREMALVADRDFRTWTSDGRFVAESRVWGAPVTRSDYGSNTDGHRLTVLRSFIDQLLETTKRSLLVEVVVRRRWTDRSYSTRRGVKESERFQYLEPYYKYYLVEAGGSTVEY